MQTNNKLIVDFHTHILPGIDDGAVNTEQSVSLLECAGKMGIETVVATPHFYPHKHTVNTFLKNRKVSYSRLKDKKGIPQIICGAEVLMCEGIENMEGIEMLCIENTNTMLIELPFSKMSVTKRMEETVKKLVSEKGFNVVLAHPNRYDNKIVENMINVGVSLQINMEDTGAFFARRTIKKWMDAGKVSAIGSDTHRSPRRYAEMDKLNKYLGKYFDIINEKTMNLLKG